MCPKKVNRRKKTKNNIAKPSRELYGLTKAGETNARLKRVGLG